MTGSLCRQFGWTALAAVLFSLLVARLLTPMMAAYLLKPRPRQHVDGLLMTRYLRAVRLCLEHLRKTVASASAFFLVSLLMIHQLPLTFLASSDASTEVRSEARGVGKWCVRKVWVRLVGDTKKKK